MKQIVTHLVLTIVMCLMPSIALAQNTSEHLKFMNIPICGTVENFEKRLEEKGFSQFEIPGFYKGYWDGDSVLISLAKNERLNLVYGVDVIVKTVPITQKKEILSSFESYKDRIERKYKIIDTSTSESSKMYFIEINNKFIGGISVRYIEDDEEIYLAVTYFDDDGMSKNIKEEDKDL